ncbi:MAG TPA: TetR/AcrR family transcriptional regulator [Chitinophagaceae bacterium]|nr:TetR/AcrR family transcriptional regulator [Chitinophagaceae bacterium]
MVNSVRLFDTFEIMASKDRIQRLKDDTRQNILSASLDIVKEEGWQALSMRKIADKIEYTAPIIYEYFSNKDAILQELTKCGFQKLARQMEDAANLFTEPERQLEAMWLAYWNFAFSEKELYQVMYGVQISCCVNENPCVIMKGPEALLRKKIEELMPAEKRSKEYIDRRYYTFWSVVHGLISINMTRQLTSESINRQVLKDAIDGMIHAIKT